MSGNGLGSKPTLGVNRSARRRASAAGTSSSETAMGMGSRSNDVSRTSDSPVCVQEYVHTPIILCRVTAWNTVAVAFEPAGPGSPPPAWPIFKGIVQASTTCGDRRRQSCCLRILACPFCVCSVRPESPWTGQKNCQSSLTQRRMLKSPKLMLLPESVDARVRYRGRFL